jgi:hypothetical protein
MGSSQFTLTLKLLPVTFIRSFPRNLIILFQWEAPFVLNDFIKRGKR